MLTGLCFLLYMAFLQTPRAVHFLPGTILMYTGLCIMHTDIITVYTTDSSKPLALRHLEIYLHHNIQV